MAILRLTEVLAYTGHRSHATIYNAVKRGMFTKPVPLGKRSTGWPLHEVEAIVAAQVAGLPDDDVRELVELLHEQRKTRFQILLSAQLTPLPPTATNIVQLGGVRA